MPISAGHDSHGIQMIAYYLDCMKAGGLDPVQRGRIAVDNGSVLVVDGDLGFGAMIGAYAMDQGIARVRDHGVVLVAVRNSHHLGRIGSWAERCLDANVVSLHFVNGQGHEPLAAALWRHTGTPGYQSVLRRSGRQPVITRPLFWTLRPAVSLFRQGRRRP